MSETIVRLALDSIRDSRGQWTVEATVELDGGASGRAGAPSGASTSHFEAQAFPDGGVPVALERFRSLVAPRLVGLSAADLGSVDAALHEVDGTPNFSRIGGNTATAVSVATAIASARARREPLWKRLARPGVEGRAFPAIVGNCLNGGRHAIGGPDIQEFIAFADGPTPDASIDAAVAVHRWIGEELHRRLPTVALGRGDEGGWVAPIGNVDALELLARACDAVRDATGVPVYPGLDLAASEFFRDGRYRYREQTLDTDGQIGFVTELVDRYGIRYLEDPIEESDYEGFARVTAEVGPRTLVVGDDLYATSPARVERGIAARATNAVLLKVNQIGTLTDTMATDERTRSAGWSSVVSHRSGEVPEGWLAHVAVGLEARALKCGVLGGERVAKLNELLRLGRATP